MSAIASASKKLKQKVHVENMYMYIYMDYMCAQARTHVY